MKRNLEAAFIGVLLTVFYLAAATYLIRLALGF